MNPLRIGARRRAELVELSAALDTAIATRTTTPATTTAISSMASAESPVMRLDPASIMTQPIEAAPPFINLPEVEGRRDPRRSSRVVLRCALIGSFALIAGAATLTLQQRLNQPDRLSANNPGPGSVYVKPTNMPHGLCLTNATVTETPPWGTTPPQMLTLSRSDGFVVVWGPSWSDTLLRSITAGEAVQLGDSVAYLAHTAPSQNSVVPLSVRAEWSVKGQRFAADSRGLSGAELVSILRQVSFDAHTNVFSYAGNGFSSSTRFWMMVSPSTVRRYERCEAGPTARGASQQSLTIATAVLTASPPNYWFPPEPFTPDTETITVPGRRSLRVWRRTSYTGAMTYSWAEGNVGHWVVGEGLTEDSLESLIAGLRSSTREAAQREAKAFPPDIGAPSPPEADSWTPVVSDPAGQVPLVVEAGKVGPRICLRARVTTGVSKTPGMCLDDIGPDFRELQFTSTWSWQDRADVAVVDSTITRVEAVFSDGTVQQVNSGVDRRFARLRVFARQSSNESALPRAYRFFDKDGDLVFEQR